MTSVLLSADEARAIEPTYNLTDALIIIDARIRVRAGRGFKSAVLEMWCRHGTRTRSALALEAVLINHGYQVVISDDSSQIQILWGM